MADGQRCDDRGETLIEVIITIVIISLAVGALIASLATAAASAKAYRDNVVTDTVIRNYAEAIKAGADTCTVDGTYDIDYTPVDAGFSVTVSPPPPEGTGMPCPSTGATTQLALSVVGPAGITKTMQIKVRTP